MLESPQSLLLHRVECVRVLTGCAVQCSALQGRGQGLTKADKQPIDALHCECASTDLCQSALLSQIKCIMYCIEDSSQSPDVKSQPPEMQLLL